MQAARHAAIGVLLYPKGHPRRKKFIADLKIVPRWERPFWVAETLLVAVFEGLPFRFAAWRNGRKARRVDTDRQEPSPRWYNMVGGLMALVTVGIGLSKAFSLSGCPLTLKWNIMLRVINRGRAGVTIR